MKWLFKWLLRLVTLLVVIVVLVLVFRDSLLRGVVEQEIRAQTGMDAKIGKFSSSLFAPVATLENLKLYNTAEFGGRPFAEIPELHVEIDPSALTKQKLRVTLMRCRVAELDVVKNEAGQTNIVNLFTKASARVTKSGGIRITGRLVDFDTIELLDLSLAKARFIDMKDPRNNHEVRIDMDNQPFREVKSQNDLNGILTMIWLRSGGAFAMNSAEAPRATSAPVPAKQK